MTEEAVGGASMRIEAYCIECGDCVSHVEGEADDGGVAVSVEKCHCLPSLDRTEVVEYAVQLVTSQKGSVLPKQFVEYCRAIEGYLRGESFDRP